MPLTRYQIRNEYGLADPELYRAADKDDPEALLEGVAMAGLVGVLRQLGDLAEFAAEIFHDLHEDLMATAARGHGLMVRVQQLEAEVPSIEKAFLSQTSHSSFFYNAGIEWHPNLHMDQNLITQRDLPRFVMDSYEECRGPPRLFLLDKFDVAGAGACLKRYTDPSFFKVEPSSSELTNAEVQREKKVRKTKKKGSRWKNGETPDILPTSHAKLHQLFLEERVESGVNDPARPVKLKRRLNGFPFDSRTGKSYMDKFLKAPSPDHKMVREISVCSSPLKLPSGITGESGLEIIEISTVSPDKDSFLREGSPYSSPNMKEIIIKPSMDVLNEKVTDGTPEIPKVDSNLEANNALPKLDEVVDEKDIAVDGENKTEGGLDGHQSDDIASETEYFVDALTTMESEVETDIECRAKNDRVFFNYEQQAADSDANTEQHELQAEFSESQSLGNSTASDDGSSSTKKEIPWFSYSKPVANLPKSSFSDGDVSAKVFRPTEIWEGKAAENISSDQHSDNDEIPASQPTAHELFSGKGTESTLIPSSTSEIAEPSNSCVTDVADTQDQGARSTEDLSLAPVLGETTSGCDELVTGLIVDEENGRNLGESVSFSSNHSDVPSQVRDDFVPVVSSENCSVNQVNDEDPNVYSDASLQFSNILVLAPEDRSGEILLDNIPLTAEDGRSKHLTDSPTDSPQSIISHKEAQPYGSASPEVKVCDSNLEPDGVVLVVDDSEAWTSFSGEKKTSVALAVDGDAMGEFTPEKDITGDLAPLEFPYDFPDEPDPPSIIKAELHLYDGITGTVQSEVETAASVASVTEDSANDNRENVDSLSSNHTKALEESLFGDGESPKNQSEITETSNLEDLKQSSTGTQRDQQQVASSDVDSGVSNADTYSHSTLELPDDSPDLFMDEDVNRSLHFSDAQMISSSLAKKGQGSDNEPPQQSNLRVNSEDFVSSPNCYLPELNIPLEQKVKLNADQPGDESQHVDEINSFSSFQLEGIQSKNHLVQENCVDASNIHQSFPPRAPSVPEILEESRSLELHVSKQAMDPSRPRFPAFGLLPEATRINHEDMPPLPPLPPMQWRIGKGQHAFLHSERGSEKESLGNLFPTFPTTTDGKAQLSFPALEGETSQPSNVFSPLSAMEYDQRVYENLAGNVVHSSSLSSQVPTMVDHGNTRRDFIYSERIEATNPFLTSPARYTVRSSHGSEVVERRTQQPCSNPFSTVTDFEDIASASDQRSTKDAMDSHLLTPEGTLGNENLWTSTNLEGKVVNPSDRYLPPKEEEEQPRHDVLTSGGETACSASAPIPLPDFEDGKTNGTLQTKIPRPRNPLIDAVVAHDKSKMRKVTERVRPQIGEKADERDSLLDQIRTKSFNLKPAVVTRPSIQGPKTNLKLAAILEKANAIRQALAGSDEDDDPDSWSDS